KKAKEVYGEDKDRLNELIQRSSDLEREYKTKILKLDEDIENYERLTRNLKEQKESLDAHIYTEKSKLHKEYYDAKEEAKKAIKAKKVEESHQHLNIAHKKVVEIKTQTVKEVEAFKVGDRVKYQSSKGEILSIKGNKAFILNDLGMRVQVNLALLQRSGNPIKGPSKKVSVSVQKPETGKISLDLHGQRSDEAIENLDKFISDSLIAGFDEVLVYHGIGSGKLSYAVKKYLDAHPKVKGYSDAHPSSGGFGAKVIQL
ncbi:MAG: endonuclease MutS2, partial [Deltaproteobacteria bacterium HGW-Deltaproteobacteria-24]